MIRVILLSILLTQISFAKGISQTIQEDTIFDTIQLKEELKGLVLDIDSQIGLPYANIYVLHKNIGVISNEKGYFSINIKGLNSDDTIRFQYIGYKTKNITIGELDTSKVVYLKEEIFNLSETIIFGNKLNAESIVKKVLENKESNYKKTTAYKQAFIREKDIADIEEMNLNLKKSSFSEIDPELLELVEEKTPKHSTSYTDFLGNLYSSSNENDSITFKIDPIRTVSLKEKDIAELEQIETVFKNIFNNTEEEEYWKIKTGILSQKIDVNEEKDEPKKDSLNENERKVSSFRRRILSQLNYSTMNYKKEWEFLHSTGKYKYNIIGGTRVNGEDVYIIDFTPRSGGEFIGRMYISMNTFALIRADYEYAPDKTGTDIHLFGVGYTEDQFSGSIYFEKKDSTYSLKYFSRKAGSYASFDRSLSLLKKRKRFLFDKKLDEFKVGVILSVKMEESVEFVVLDDKQISHNEYADFEQKEKMEIIYVDQFDDKLWSGYSIIEPTKQMREYRKQKVDYNF
ncbi:MAG: hypothetical protein CL661_10245 [Bacteroidetes bacterium]|nr:hypothetical protein [Bacteroidota bacterium]|tara:strand:- start:1911 stop:3452 length:1542 start_codon:yes stop_codon:yes gene_type:complete